MSLTLVQSLLAELELKGALEQFNVYVNNPNELDNTPTVDILVSLFNHEITIRGKRKQESLIKTSRLPIYAEIP